MHKSAIKTHLGRLIFSSIITFLLTLPFHYFFQIIAVSELRPASALPPALGLIFGPWGALGAAIGNLAADISIGYPPEIFLISFLAQFLYGYLPYKLWYTLDKKNPTLPRLNSVHNLIKFIIIIFISSLVMAGLLGLLMENLEISSLVSFTTLLFAFNNFDFSLMLGTLIIVGANLYGLSFYQPEISKKAKINPLIFDFLLILALIMGGVYAIYIIYSGTTNGELLLGITFYLLVMAYCFKPLSCKIDEKTSPVRISLTEKLIVMFIVIGALVTLLTAINSYYSITEIGSNLAEFWEAVYLNITLIITIFYISAIACLWYIEKQITQPIESISYLLSNYISRQNKIDSQDITLYCKVYARTDTEVGILAHSFQQMVQDLEDYIENLKEATAQKERINAELNVAQKIQADMLPRKFPAFPERNEFEVYAANIPAREVGGDFYDFFLVDDDHLALVIGDVSGKGVPAALFMVIAKTLIKNQAQLDKTPSEVFNIVNNQLNEGNEESMFVTTWMGILEISTGKLTYVNAGHNHPLIKKGENGYEWLKSKPGFVLAGMEDILYQEQELILKTGDRIYLYTDGITEAINPQDELFGDSNLQYIMNNTYNLSLSETLSFVKGKIDSFVEDREQFDDITMMILEYKK